MSLKLYENMKIFDGEMNELGYKSLKEFRNLPF